jgi:hypothetical protein
VRDPCPQQFAGNQNKCKDRDPGENHSAGSKAIDQSAGQWNANGAREVVQRESERNRSAAGVKILNKRLQENAEREHNDGTCAEEQP